MIVDAHCHAWRNWPYQPPVPDPGRGSAQNLLFEMDNAGVARAVVICAAIGDNPANAEDNLAEAREAGGRLVPFIDVDCRWHATHCAPGAAGRLRAALDRFAPAGVTFYMQEDAPADWLLSQDGLDFLALLQERRLVLSLACGPSQAEAVAEAARRAPRLPVLVHHLWRVPAGDDEALARVVAAAAAANVFVKLSGFGYGEADGWDFPLPRMQKVAAALLAACGPRRLLWGSDWPVSARFMTYRQTLEIVRSHGPAITPDERALVLGGNMERLLAGEGLA